MEYAADTMASIDYRIMSLAGRGMLYSLRLECWRNGRVPSDVEKLAKILGFKKAEVESALNECMSFMQVDGDWIICPELERYRAHLDSIRKAQSEGGALGLKIREENKKKKKGKKILEITV